jgi:hypothetical protein
VSLQIVMNIGCFNWEQASDAFIVRSLTASEVDAAIVRCGGRLLADEHETQPQLTTIARLVVREGGQDVRGFLGRAVLVRHPLGYVRLALDGRSAGPVAAFLRLLNTQFGCGVYVWNDEETDPARVITWLENLGELKPA